MTILYLPKEFLETAFAFITSRYSRHESVPEYVNEPRFEEFCSLLLQVKSDYYPTVLDKAAYLLIGINKGHFFSNGNKRLALTICTFFLVINGLSYKEESKDWYRQLLGRIFPEYNSWEDFPDFESTDFGTYNLSIIIADSGVYGIHHQELKRRLNAFFTEALERF